ncbi:MAG TPA: DNA polymerase III subunit gamma/tau [Anaerolineales bacterium]|nr:DNA polymerase III subunit gamma/tau [Anaerolineales bacterium]
MSQALYRKWRPHRWDQVVGQEHVIRTLQNAVAADRVAHAYLFSGPRGTGKTTTARLLAKAANCLDEDLSRRPCDQCEHCLALNAGRFLDLIEIDAASNTSVDDVRDLRDKINFSPNQGRYKIYIIDEVHMLSTAAFNALLKTLEEPPPHAIFILATTEVHKIPATVLSRCQRHEFRRIPVVDILAYLREVAAGENLQVEPEAMAIIARQATGSLRDAVSLLDQLASSGDDVTLELAQSVLGTAASQAVLDLVEAIIARDPAAGLDHLHHTLDAGSDPRQFARQIVEYLRNLLLIRMGSADQVDATTEMRAQMARQAQEFSAPQLLDVIRAFNYAANDARGAWQPALPLEMAFVESLDLSDEDQKPEDPAGTPAKTPPRDSSSATEKVSSRAPDSPPALAQSPAEEYADLSPEDQQARQVLGQNWNEILNLVRLENPNTYGLLNSCRLRHLKGNLFTLGFASDVLKNQMTKRENLEIVQRVLSRVLDKEISVRCVITTGRRNPVPPEVDNDGMVAAALRDLGGEIVDIQ